MVQPFPCCHLEGFIIYYYQKWALYSVYRNGNAQKMQICNARLELHSMSTLHNHIVQTGFKDQCCDCQYVGFILHYFLLRVDIEKYPFPTM